LTLHLQGYMDMRGYSRLARVGLAIARAQRLEAVEPVRARLEDDARGTPVALEEGVEVLAVPGLDLHVEQPADGGLNVVGSTSTDQHGGKGKPPAIRAGGRRWIGMRASGRSGFCWCSNGESRPGIISSTVSTLST
jgi:hypothetical protein